MVAVNQLIMFGFEALLVSVLLIFLFWLRRFFGTSPLCIAIGVFQPLQIILASSIYGEIFPGITISPGSVVMFTGSLFAILLVYIFEDAVEARKVIYGIVIVNIAMSTLFLTFGWHMTLPGTLNFINIPREIFNQSIRVTLSGTLTLFFDVLLIILLFEALRLLVPGRSFIRIFLTMAIICTFDTVLFATLAFYGNENFTVIITSGIIGKITISLLYSAILRLYLHLHARHDSSAMQTNPVIDIFHILTYREKYEYEHNRAEHNEAILKAAIEQSPIGIIIADAPDIHITFTSTSGLKMRGGNPDKLINISHHNHAKNWQVYKINGELCKDDELPLYRAIVRGETIKGEELILRNEDGQNQWIRSNAAPIRDTRGNITSGIVFFDNITELKMVEAELNDSRNVLEELVDKRTNELREMNNTLKKEIAERIIIEEELKNYSESQKVLIREVNHRVKNNLSAIIGMIHKQEEYAVKFNSQVNTDIFNDLGNRIQSLAAVHSLLSDTGWKPLNVSELCTKIIALVFQGLPIGKTASYDIDSTPLYIDSDQAQHLTLVINELAMNTVKHSLSDRDSVAVSMSFTEGYSQLDLVYSDNGPGYPPEMIRGDFSKCNVGFDLLRGIITESLMGSFTLSNKDGATIHFSILTTPIKDRHSGR